MRSTFGAGVFLTGSYRTICWQGFSAAWRLPSEAIVAIYRFRLLHRGCAACGSTGGAHNFVAGSNALLLYITRIPHPPQSCECLFPAYSDVHIFPHITLPCYSSCLLAIK